MSRDFDKTFGNFRLVRHAVCYGKYHAKIEWHAICRKSLRRKHLGRFCGRDFAVSPYAVRVYDELTG